MPRQKKRNIPTGILPRTRKAVWGRTAGNEEVLASRNGLATLVRFSRTSIVVLWYGPLKGRLVPDGERGEDAEHGEENGVGPGTGTGGSSIGKPSKQSKLCELPADKPLWRCPHKQCGHRFDASADVNTHMIMDHVDSKMVRVCALDASYKLVAFEGND